MDIFLVKTIDNRTTRTPGADVDFYWLRQGKIDFVIAQPDTLIKARISGAKVKAIAAIYRIHPLVFCSLSKKKIIKPRDFAGKTIGVAYSEEIMLKAMLKRLKINLEEINIVKRNYDFTELVSGKLDVQGAWITDEVQTAKRNGLQIKMVLPSNYAVIFYADVIVTKEKMTHNNPQLVERFLKATLKGWSKAIENPKENAKLTLLYNPQLNYQHELDVLETSMPLIHTGEDFIGWMKSEDWQYMYQTMVEQTIVEDTLNPEDLYTMQFLKTIYSQKTK